MDRPQVSLVASSLPPAPQDRPAVPRSRRAPLVVGTALLLLVLGARGGTGAPAAPEPPPQLVLRGEALTVTLGGVLVVPLELRNPGGRLAVRSAQVFASPVGSDPSVQAPEQVAAGDDRRFVALLAPDCRLLRGTGTAFSAGLILRVARGPAEAQLLLDLSADPVVADRVRSLCG